MSSQFTPVKPHAGSIQNFNVSMASSGDSRRTYSADLVGHIEYKSRKPINVYKDWSVAGIDAIVDTIAATIATDLAEFQSLVQKGVHEAELYPPLQNMFRKIEGAEKTGYKRSQFRQLVAMSEHVPDAENMSFPDNKPDFVLAEVPPTSESLTHAVDVGNLKWRQVCGFIEIKTSSKDDPNAKNPTTVKTIVSQGANYARLILAARPFQLYVLCIFIYGSSFCLGWYDRRGVILSEEYDMKGNLKVLIRVVLQLTTHMTSYQLGHDTTARLLEGHSYYQEQYPSFTVSMGGGGNNPPQWRTYGAPIWSSLSLLGRGTATWRAVSLQDQQKVVLKTLWRSQTRQSESDIYSRIKPASRGIAELTVGNDVRATDGETLVTVGWLRSHILDNDIGVRDDPVLHRLALTTLGRPLWDARTTEEFILGSYAALKGHETLFDQGILHRDMSPGNIYLGEAGCPEGWEGFVADLELAWVGERVTKDRSIPRPKEAGQRNERYYSQEYTVLSSSRAPGAEITGTALFMARELLDKMSARSADQKSKNGVRPAEIERGVHHDLESFILVLFYAVMKRSLESGVWRKHPDLHRIQRLYRKLFGGHTIEEISSGRSGLVDPIPGYLFLAVDEPMRKLLYGCQTILHRQYSRAFNDPSVDDVDEELQSSSERQQPTNITYEKLHSVYTIAKRALSVAK